MIFADYGATVLDRREREGVRGIVSERNRFDLHLADAPFFGMALTEIRSCHIRGWLQAMQEKKARDTRGDRLLSSQTIARSKALVSAILSRAVEDELVDLSECLAPHFRAQVCRCTEKAKARRDRRRLISATARKCSFLFGNRLAHRPALTTRSARRCVMRAVDLTGRVFGRLRVLCFVGSVKDSGGHARRMYRVRCECGTEKLIASGHLTSSKTVSCGCYTLERIREIRTRHGGRGLPEYRTWSAMIDRCHREGNDGFANYGGRGIKVCEKWRKSFQAFYDHVGPKPTPDHSIDRIDVDGDYEPGNVRWATRTEQSMNTRAQKAKLTLERLRLLGLFRAFLETANDNGEPNDAA